ncbi:hypothetical protein ACT3SZ_15535 [Corynebacterium sp. AOP40-9SA-29]|uniref:hypothetical protein n=1 Tax=Corynebacterium sp. AOP40-9SA-29 TaxID=3457677 RepID=UPI00403499DA
MTTFAPTITNYPDLEFPVSVKIPGSESSYGFKDQDQADSRISRLSPAAPHTTRITTDTDQLRRILAPITQIAHRTPDLPVLNTVRIQSLDSGVTRLSATDRYIIMRGELRAECLGEPVNLTIRAGEAQIILDLLGPEPGPVEHCEACTETADIDSCWRDHGEPEPVILDIGPGTLQVTTSHRYKTTITIDTSDVAAHWDKVDPMVDELTRPDELNVIGHAANPALVPTCEEIMLAPRASQSGDLRWAIVSRRRDRHLFDGMLMPLTEEADQ